MSAKITAEIVTATKELVDTLLAMNTNNRKPKQGHVEYLKKEILAQEFEVTSQGIGLTKNGVLADGQHRLLAIKEAGYPPVEILLVRGLSDKAQLKTDIGAKRNVADMLRLYLNTTVSNSIVAAINVIAKFVNGKVRISPQETAEMLVEYEESINQLNSVEGFATTVAPVYGAFLYTLHKSENAKILIFAKQVATGELLKSDDPALVLRKFLQSGPSGRKGGHDVQKDRFGKTIYAIDAFINEQKIQRLHCRELPTKVEMYLKSRKEAA
jgi:hypothetical protein